MGMAIAYNKKVPSPPAKTGGEGVAERRVRGKNAEGRREKAELRMQN
jgi:hypothetical protein